MANERQFFRDINPGDVSIEGRKSNGITADINGNTIIYAGIKQSELQKLNQEKYLGNVPIDGYTSTFIAALAPGQLPPYPAGNNNNETYFESKTTDPNKIIVANPQITPTPTPQPTVTITPTPTSLPTRETVQISPAPSYTVNYGEDQFIESPGLSQESVVMMTGSLDIDVSLSPEITIQGTDEKNVAGGKTDYSNIIIIKLGSVTYNSNGTINKGSKANEFLPRNASGAITPYYSFIAAAKASIGTYTKTLKGTESKDKDGNYKPGTGGALGCGGGVAIIYLRAVGHGMDGWDVNKTPPKPGEKVNLILGTASIYSHLRSDTKNWRARANWKDAQPGDCLDTVTIGSVNGHIGWVVDTKLNDGVSWDVVSNSSSGYTGKVKDKNLAGSIQNNYTVKTWESVANRKGVGQTFAYQFIGKFDEPNRTI